MTLANRYNAKTGSQLPHSYQTVALQMCKSDGIMGQGAVGIVGHKAVYYRFRNMQMSRNSSLSPAIVISQRYGLDL